MQGQKQGDNPQISFQQLQDFHLYLSRIYGVKVGTQCEAGQ